MTTEQKHTRVNIVESRIHSAANGWHFAYFWTCECGESSGDCFSKYSASRDWHNHALSYDVMDLITSRRVMIDRNLKAIEDFIEEET